MKTKITIEWDSETREALVQINDREPILWTDSDFSMLKDLSEDDPRVVLRRRIVLEQPVGASE